MGTCSKFQREKAGGVLLTRSGLADAWESAAWGLMSVSMCDRETHREIGTSAHKEARKVQRGAVIVLPFLVLHL